MRASRSSTRRYKDIAVKINGTSPDKFTSYIKQKLAFTVSYTTDETSEAVKVEWSRDGKVFDGTLVNGGSPENYTVICKLTQSGYTYEKAVTVYVVNPLDITDHLTAGTIEKTTYTGSAITPDMTVKYGGETLVYGIDYTTSYTDNLRAGTAAVKISPVDGKRYTFEEKTITFEITPKTIAVSGVTVDYETALPVLTELSEGREYGRLGFGINAENGAVIGRVGEIRVVASTTNFEDILLTINVEGVERIAPEMKLTPDSYRVVGGGKLTLTLDRGNLPADATVTVTGTDEKGNVIPLAANGDIFTAELPNRSTSYTFRAEFGGSFIYLPETVSVSVETSYSGLIIIPANPVKLPDTENGSVTSDSDKVRPG